MRFEKIKEGVKCQIVVKTDMNKEKLMLEGDDLVFYTHEPSLHGRANAALIRFLSRILNLSSSKIKIIYGYRERVKTVLIKDVNEEYVRSHIEKFLGI